MEQLRHKDPVADVKNFSIQESIDMVGSKECKQTNSVRIAHSWVSIAVISGSQVGRVQAPTLKRQTVSKCWKLVCKQ